MQNAATTATSLAVLLLSLILPAQDNPQRGGGLEQRFRQLDRNGDGQLQREELPEGVLRLFERLDVDKNGVVSAEEAAGLRQPGAAAAKQDKRASAGAEDHRVRLARPSVLQGPAATIPHPDTVNAPPGPPPAAPPVSLSRAFAELKSTGDYFPGTQDARGQCLSGTETMRILQHQGKLFASTGDWMDLPYFQAKGNQPWTGPQVLIKESARAPWRVDVSFPKAIRVDGMISATFATDGAGRPLDPPVRLLVASPSSEDTAAWTRDDATGQWTECVAVEGLRGGLRSFCTHWDLATGIQHLFGGATKSGSVFRGVYDPAAPGRLRWDPTPELVAKGRVMCMAEANGVLYAAIGIKDETPLSGGLFRRVDGPQPCWELLWRWPHLIRAKGDETEILRGLTAVPDPQGGPGEVLLGTCDYPGVVYRIDPARNQAVTTELDIRAYFAQAFGLSALRGPCLSAYNNFLPAVDPATGERVHLLGLWISHPHRRNAELRESAWYLVRHADGTYSHGRVFDPANPRPNPPRGLAATRTIEVSPFPEDRGRVLYFGGYDCADIESHNTAWIYRGELPAAERGKP